MKQEGSGEGSGEGTKTDIKPGDWVPPDQALVQLDANEPENPRLKINCPANKIFLELTDTNPPFCVVVVRADNPVMAKGALMQALTMLLVGEVKLNERIALTQGVSGAALKDLTKGPIKGGKPS